MPRTSSSSSDKRLRRIFLIHQKLRTLNSFSAEELATACYGIDSAINERTIRADIQFLRELGAAIPKGNKHQKFFYKSPFSLIHTLEGVQEGETNEMLAYLNQLYQKAPKAAFLELDKVFLALEQRIKTADAIGDARLQFDKTAYTGQNRISELYDYIVRKRTIDLTYTPFGGSQQNRTIFPVFLKEYNQRWFLIAFDADRLTYQNFALDRIDQVQLSDSKLALDKLPDPESYFHNLIGVSLEGELTNVRIRIKKPRAFYVKTKPWHNTQRQFQETKEFIDFEWDVYVNRELKSKIFELGYDAEVIFPTTLKSEIETKP
ncbi:helix-turn-helix transcriptional regulator [Dyadobacter jiangsuensis]